MIRKMSNKKTQGILMAAAMSFNLLNTVAVQMPRDFTADSLLHNIKRNEAKPETYTAACCKALDFADSLFFGKAEAATVEDINSGTDKNNTKVGSGGTVDVQNVNGGMAGLTGIYSGGTQNVNNGKALNTTIYSGGMQIVKGGTAGIVNINDGGKQIVLGGTTGVISINKGGVETVSAGVVIGGTAFSGGVQEVLGGTVSKMVVATGGVQEVRGGVITKTKVSGRQSVLGGTATDNKIFSGGVQLVQGGTANTNVINSGAKQNIADGLAINNTIEAGGVQQIAVGTAQNTTVNSSGVQKVFGGTVFDTTIKNGGLQTVKGGSVSRTTIEAGAIQDINAGTVTTVTIAKEGVENVTGGVIKDVTVYGTQNVSSGETSLNKILAGGKQIVLGGTVSDNVIEGTQDIKGGAANNNTVDATGVQNVISGTATGNTIGGTQNVNGGIATNNIVENKGVQNVVAGTVSVTTLENGGSQVVSGGVVSETTINGGSQEVHAGQVNDTIINAGTATYQGGTIKTTTLNNGTANFQNGTIQDTTINAGTASFQGGTVKNTTINNGIANFQGSTIQDTTINAGTVNFQGGTIDNTTLKNGVINVENDKAAVKDVTMTGGTLSLAQNSGNYTIGGTLNFNGGVIDMTGNQTGTTTATATQGTLTIDNLKGNGGTLVMDTNFASQTNGDKVTVKAADKDAGGTIQVYDKSFSNGQATTENKKLLLGKDESGVTNWTGKALNDGGLWDVTPTIAKEGNDWYLTGETKEANAEVKTADSSIASNFATWKNSITNDTLRKRLGDLRLTGNAQQGIWTRVKAGKLNGSGYEGNFQTYNLGYDMKKGNAIYGAAVDYTRGTSEFKNGSGDNTRVGLNLYASSYHPSGVYSDFIIRAGKIKNSMTNISGYNDTADWSNWGYSASYEQGKTFMHKNGWFFEPGAEITLGRLQGSSFTTNKGVSVNTGAMNVAIGRLGFALGRRVNKNCDYYLKGNVYREFAGSGSIDLRSTNGDTLHQNENHRDTWFELGLGGNVKLSKTTYLYGDVTKTFGADINTKWQVNAGLRFAF